MRLFTLFLCLISFCCFASETCQGPYEGKLVSREDILALQKQNAYTPLNLCGAILTGQDLSGLNLQGAIFENTHLIHANLSGGDFTRASFKKADLGNANLTSASFEAAYMGYANLTDAILKDALFLNADLYKVIYKPRLGDPPNLAGLEKSRHFKNMDFSGVQGEAAMIQLNSAFWQAGMKNMGTLLTSMVNENKMQAAFNKGGLHTIKGLLLYFFFYLTCDFGHDPARPLLMLIGLIFLGTLPYYWSLGARSPYAGILVRWTSRRDPLMVLEVSYQHFIKIYTQEPGIRSAIKRYRKFLTALYFSLLSSFHLGSDDFTLSNWIVHIQTRNYKLIPKGWVRSLSGIQALLGGYLLILSVLCYFGPPFYS